MRNHVVCHSNGRKKRPVLDCLSAVAPIGIGINALKVGITGKPTSVGELSSELKVTDALDR